MIIKFLFKFFFIKLGVKIKILIKKQIKIIGTRFRRERERFNLFIYEFAFINSTNKLKKM
jgi:hypothetical protein